MVDHGQTIVGALPNHSRPWLENYSTMEKPWLKHRISVVVKFYPWFKIYFPLFWVMVMYDNKFETKENKI